MFWRALVCLFCFVLLREFRIYPQFLLTFCNGDSLHSFALLWGFSCWPYLIQTLQFIGTTIGFTSKSASFAAAAFRSLKLFFPLYQMKGTVFLFSPYLMSAGNQKKKCWKTHLLDKVLTSNNAFLVTSKFEDMDSSALLLIRVLCFWMTDISIWGTISLRK